MGLEVAQSHKVTQKVCLWALLDGVVLHFDPVLLLLGQVPCWVLTRLLGSFCIDSVGVPHAPGEGPSRSGQVMLGLCASRGQWPISLLASLPPKPRSLVLVSLYQRERAKEELIRSLPPTRTDSLRRFACSPLHTANSPKGIKKRAMAIALGQQLHNSPQEHRAA